MFLVKILISLGQRTFPWKTTGETFCRTVNCLNVFSVYLLFSPIRSVLKWLCMLQWYEHKAPTHFEIFQLPLSSKCKTQAKMEPNLRKLC